VFKLKICFKRQENKIVEQETRCYYQGSETAFFNHSDDDFYSAQNNLSAVNVFKTENKRDNARGKNLRVIEKRLSPYLAKILKRLHYPIDMILVTVRGYIACSLSLRNVEKMTLEQNISVNHSTIYQSGIKLAPLSWKRYFANINSL